MESLARLAEAAIYTIAGFAGGLLLSAVYLFVTWDRHRDEADKSRRRDAEGPAHSGRATF